MPQHRPPEIAPSRKPGRLGQLWVTLGLCLGPDTTPLPLCRAKTETERQQFEIRRLVHSSGRWMPLGTHGEPHLGPNLGTGPSRASSPGQNCPGYEQSQWTDRWTVI
jgi:hypothetical protein